MKGCWNFGYYTVGALISWELGEYYIRIVRNDASGSPGAFNIAWAIGLRLCYIVKAPEGSLD